MRSSRTIVSVCAVTLLLLALPNSALAGPPPPDYFYVDAYNGHYTMQPNRYTCVSASSVTWIGQIKNWTNNNQYSGDKALTWFNTAWDGGWNRYDYQNKSFGLDPRAWAKLMFNKSPAYYTYNDYIYTSHSAANAAIVHNINGTGEAVGALVAQGRHAILVTGFASDIDPIYSSWQLWGFYVVDPWRGRGSMSLGDPPAPYNLSPDYYIPVNTWNSEYHELYDNYAAQGAYTASDGSTKYNTIWDDNYTVVLRKASGSEAPIDPWNAQPPMTDSTGGVGGAPVADQPPTFSSVSDAVAGGIQHNGLQSDHGLGVGLVGVSVGSSVFVDALDDGIPDYYLVSLDRGGQTIALAIVNTDGNSYWFGGVARAEAGFRLPSRADAARALGLSSASVNASWRTSDDTPTPFDPVWVGQDGAGRWHAVTMAGAPEDAP